MIRETETPVAEFFQTGPGCPCSRSGLRQLWLDEVGWAAAEVVMGETGQGEKAMAGGS